METEADADAAGPSGLAALANGASDRGANGSDSWTDQGEDLGLDYVDRTIENNLEAEADAAAPSGSATDVDEVIAIESRQSEMTVTFCRNKASTVPSDLPGYFAPEDLGFGQRYHVTGDTASVVVTKQRTLPDIMNGDRECCICTDTKDVTKFPGASITISCTHPPGACLECIAASIKSDLNNRLWNDIRCPECREVLQYDDVQRFADEETKERYQTLSFRYVISEAENFLWCTSGCGYGQVHDGGVERPIVTCLLCNHRSCFHHKLAWHENLTCDEYDALQADPTNFRSRFELENEAADAEAVARRAQEDADRAFAQSLLAEEQQAAERKRIAQAQAEARKKEQEEREMRVRLAEEARKEAARRKKEEEATVKTIGSTTKPCPGCQAPIEKNSGCAHMTCTTCKHEFCWDCLAGYRQIIQADNRAHSKSCPWHPDNLKD
ncbi:hypothetical protein B0H66DRAFT_628584 [Apodospora peruviana]|uniref:RBR-type E3 ubiquitin transferase n=1 Tax=Apodospora peruviana TaxID=516989 RepID=A0AAE0HZE5_9PEZI|nr:hypothetical protein B0H66DRAFT_628584 [Apodospora peruviana]